MRVVGHLDIAIDSIAEYHTTISGRICTSLSVTSSDNQKYDLDFRGLIPQHAVGRHGRYYELHGIFERLQQLVLHEIPGDESGRGAQPKIIFSARFRCISREREYELATHR